MNTLNELIADDALLRDLQITGAQFKRALDARMVEVIQANCNHIWAYRNDPEGEFCQLCNLPWFDAQPGDAS